MAVGIARPHGSGGQLYGFESRPKHLSLTTIVKLLSTTHSTNVQHKLLDRIFSTQ